MRAVVVPRPRRLGQALTTALGTALGAAGHGAWWLQYQCASSRSRASRPRNDLSEHPTATPLLTAAEDVALGSVKSPK
jgi:hypothetical protein